MRQSLAFVHTLRDDPADAEVVSHRLLARAGFLQKLAAGIYQYTPPMTRVLARISQIVREEMNRAGAQEVVLPILQPKEIWEESGRWERYQKAGQLFSLTDHKGAELCLVPTAEEAVTTMVKRVVGSYRQLPLNLYQIHTKFRDEIRPRFGLMRGREFIMKDAYSFDANEEGLRAAYAKMRVAYQRIFERCGLKYTIVQADPGAIGGSNTEEFMVNAETGEDLILVCSACDYAANVEKAESVAAKGEEGGAPKAMHLEATPGDKTVEQLSKRFSLAASRMVKTVMFKAVYADREETVAVLMRGDLDVNEVKVANALGAVAVELADDVRVRAATGAEPGFAGPVGLKSGVKVLADHSVRGLANFLCGANKTDHHLLDVNFGRDLPIPETRDLRRARGGETCPKCGKGTLSETRGIEVGHIFQLGTKYSKAMDATFADEKGGQSPFVMGCYGIGVSRVAAAAVEQNHDANGITWPVPIAPWQAHVICVNAEDAAQREAGERAERELEEAGVEVLFDDRVKVSPGVKFKDADLVGVPVRVIAGRDAKEGMVEVKSRRTGEVEKVKLDGVVAAVRARLGE
ncbi:MAG TPA: proline--tRNA ligase [Planctomycetota bacterium]|nr:proline--tRNA ligase [Planctomycetota bacterium]